MSNAAPDQEVAAVQESKYWIRNGVKVFLASCIGELQECLPWWKLNQGGLYHKNGIIYGIRIGEHMCHAEYLDDLNMLTRLSWEKPGVGSHFDRRLEMAQRACDEKREIGVMIHRNHPRLAELGIEFPDGESFALMEYWVITDYWIDWQTDDKGADLKVLMARFQKVSREGVWWDAQETSDNQEPGSSSEEGTGTVTNPTNLIESRLSHCHVCGQEMVARYQDELFCGRPECDSSKRPPDTKQRPKKRTYLKGYLAQRAPMNSLHAVDREYLPPAAEQPTKEELMSMFNDEQCTRPAWSSYLCLHCGRFNQRRYWNRLQCRYCGDIVDVKLPDLSFEDVVDQKFLDLQNGADIPGMKVSNGAELLEPISNERYMVPGFGLYGANKTYVAFPKRQVIYEPGGTRDLWQRLWQAVQAGELDLERIPVTTVVHVAVPGQLTKWFGANIGETYKAGRMQFTSNNAYDGVPQVIKDIHEEIMEVVEEVLGDRPVFNEFLAIGNYPKMEMGWHDDGEEDVEGEIIASMSLEGSAAMSFGLKDVYLAGRKSKKSTKVDVDLEILPGCMEEEQKRRLRQAFESGAVTRGRYEQDMRTLVLSLNRAGNNPPQLLDFPLPGTGAVMIQVCKSSLHKYYVHKVESKGLARLVLTGRYLRSKGEREADENASSQSKKRAHGGNDGESAAKKQQQTQVDNGALE